MYETVMFLAVTVYIFYITLEYKGNYSATSKNMKLLHVDGWAGTFGTARRGLGGAAARPGPSSLYQR